jgi:hypothetical protein
MDAKGQFLWHFISRDFFFLWLALWQGQKFPIDDSNRDKKTKKNLDGEKIVDSQFLPASS